MKLMNKIKMTERLLYLLIILSLIIFNVLNIWWFSGHYDTLMNDFDRIQNLYEKNCSSNKCFLKSLYINN